MTNWIPGFFPGRKPTGASLPPTSGEVKNERIRASAPGIALHGVEGENFTFSTLIMQINELNFAIIADNTK
jgi:hypothetical protein